MYDGYQVLRFENNYKSKDLYLIGNEMNNRVGTSNYDKERTKFNIKYKELEKDYLYQDVKYKLESRNIEYLHKTKTNLLNGVTISSGPEFFMTLGLPFKETDRKYKSGKKEGQNIWTPDIKSKDDIPEEVIKYFDESYNFLKELVGKENIVMAQVHFDEYTPHLQAYFLPVVNEVKRKCYQRDKDGNLIKEIKKDINNLSKYSKEITKNNLNKSKIIEQNEIKLESKQQQIDKLNTEIKNLKSGKTLIEKDKIIENQNLIIKEKDETIKYQNNIIESLKEELTSIKEMASSLIQNVKGIATNLYKALKRTIGLNVDKNQEYDSYEFKNLIKKINKKYEKNKSYDFEL